MVRFLLEPSNVGCTVIFGSFLFSFGFECTYIVLQLSAGGQPLDLYTAPLLYLRNLSIQTFFHASVYYFPQTVMGKLFPLGSSSAIFVDYSFRLCFNCYFKYFHFFAYDIQWCWYDVQWCCSAQVSIVCICSVHSLLSFAHSIPIFYHLHTAGCLSLV